MKRLIASLTFGAAVAAAPVAIGQEFCADLSDVGQLPKKYQKRGPFHSDAQSGWIVGADQLKSRKAMDDEASALLSEIARIFQSKGITLTALVAPPRPLFAPLNALPQDFEADATARQFSGYIDAVNQAGVMAPDLSHILKTGAAKEFYFLRDTHWTPKGAALAATELAKTVLGAQANANFESIPFSQSYSEKGSLSTVAEKTCGTRPAAEVVPAPDFTKSGDANALLGASDDQTIALVGTSFSNRYDRDAYQVADAVSHAFDADVENFSVTGGGLVGAMEAFIRSGALDSGRYHTVVWEAPYTAPLSNISGLRQVLGALQNAGEKEHVASQALKASWEPIKKRFATGTFQGLEIHTPGLTEGKLELELFSDDGEKERFKLVKSDRVAAEHQSDVWTVSLAHLSMKEVSRLKIKIKGGAKEAVIHLIK